MGVRGTRNGMKKEISCTIEKEKANACSEHRRLCIKAGKWLKNNKDRSAPRSSYVVVEPVAAAEEIPDVLGWSYCTCIVIEVKTSRSDFLADKKKLSRKIPSKGLGEYRYYCCPEGLIKERELPKDWGLIYEVDGRLKVIRKAERQEACISERAIVSSILRHEGII
jgi:hypothetical protein